MSLRDSRGITCHRQFGIWSAIVLGGAILTGCARFAGGTASTLPPSTQPVTNETPPAGGPPIVAMEAASGAMSWVVTDQALLVTSDAGQSWMTLASANVVGVRSMVVVDAMHLALGAIDGLHVAIRSTTDGGNTWKESHLPTQGQPGDIRLASGHGIIAALVQQTTSANSSQADLFVSKAGSAFAKQSVPAAGWVSITAPNELWLAGGVLGNQLWRSADVGVTWREIGLPPVLGTDIGVSVPRRVSDQLILPVTVNGPGTEEVFLTSGDSGGTWHQLGGPLNVGGDSGQGVVLPLSSSDDRVVVAGPTGGLFGITAAGQSLTPISPNGLPTGVTDLDFTSITEGWAVVTQRGCAAGKSQCFAATRLFSTDDAGQTWSEVRLPT